MRQPRRRSSSGPSILGHLCRSNCMPAPVLYRSLFSRYYVHEHCLWRRKHPWAEGVAGAGYCYCVGDFAAALKEAAHHVTARATVRPAHLGGLRVSPNVRKHTDSATVTQNLAYACCSRRHLSPRPTAPPVRHAASNRQPYIRAVAAIRQPATNCNLM